MPARDDGARVLIAQSTDWRRELQPHASRQRGVTKALMLVSLPLFFFYGLVYYTDVGGAFAVLLMLYLAYRDRLLSSALVRGTTLLAALLACES